MARSSRALSGGDWAAVLGFRFGVWGLGFRGSGDRGLGFRGLLGGEWAILSRVISNLKKALSIVAYL